MMRFTIFTPTYNRAHCIYRVYKCLLNQTFTDFEWLIVDDGSNDNTKEVINSFIDENRINIRYYYKSNGGKHTAINYGVKYAQGEYFLIADSDDEFISTTLEIYNNVLNMIPINDYDKFKGAILRCMDGEKKIPIGKKFPKKIFISNDIEAYFKYKLNYEKWSIVKTSVMKEFPFPELQGIKYYPETVIWQKMAEKYKTIYCDEVVRLYYRDQNNSVTKKKWTHCKESCILWEHFLNNCINYFFNYPIIFFKASIGMNRDSIKQGYKFSVYKKQINTKLGRLLLVITRPCGWFLTRRN